MITSSRKVVMSDEEYLLLDDLIAKRFGIHYPAHKKEILESRLRPRLEAFQLRRFFDYYLLLLYNQENEIDCLARLVSNNETYFFRESYQFSALFGSGLEKLRGPLGSGRLRILSAGCSSGEEPYTLRIFAHLNGLRLSSTKIEIDAFDIDLGRLAQARTATYGSYSLRALEEEQVRRYFRKKSDERYLLREAYTEGVRFSTGNIVSLETFAHQEPYDIVFCRNVLIYFSEHALHKAIDNFAQVLQPGGLLFLGHSESIIGLDKPFDTVRLDSCLAYRRKES